jgi:hypothetical protein
MFFPRGAERSGMPKTNTALLINAVPHVQRILLFEEHMSMMPPDTVVITTFADSVKIRVVGEDDNAWTVCEIIERNGLKKSTRGIFKEKQRRQQALTILQEFEDAPMTIANAMKFVDWYYGLHRRVTIVTFDDDRVDEDMCGDNRRVITHFVQLGEPRTSIAKIAARQQSSADKLDACNFPRNFKPIISQNNQLCT